ncbi:hypothetical protein JOQ06_003684, partial [Pogonophryne albipinna]
MGLLELLEPVQWEARVEVCLIEELQAIRLPWKLSVLLPLAASHHSHCLQEIAKVSCSGSACPFRSCRKDGGTIWELKDPPFRFKLFPFGRF